MKSVEASYVDSTASANDLHTGYFQIKKKNRSEKTICLRAQIIIEWFIPILVKHSTVIILFTFHLYPILKSYADARFIDKYSEHELSVRVKKLPDIQ